MTLPSIDYGTAGFNYTLVGAGASGALPNDSWATNIYAVTGPPHAGVTWVLITITDCCYIGDFYQLWTTTDPTLATGWTLLGTTPEVESGPQLVAPTIDPVWDGDGTSYSNGSFVASIPSGVTEYFAVRDAFLGQLGSTLGAACQETGMQLLTVGCDRTGTIFMAPIFTPASFSIEFTAVASPTYEVTIYEVGLPTVDTPGWSVTLGGLTNESSSTSLGFRVPDGVYPYTIAPVESSAPVEEFAAAPASGVIAVNGSAATLVFSYLPGFSLAFEQAPGSHFPTARSWSVFLGGTFGYAPSSEGVVSFTVANGTYPFFVGLPPGSYVGENASGAVKVDGGNQIVQVIFGPIPDATFEETGMVPPYTWNVTVGEFSQTSTTQSLGFRAWPGTYNFTVRSDLYAADPANGTVDLNPQNATVSITFKPLFHSATFVESGLTKVRPWTVDLNGEVVTTSSGSIGFREVNGTYPYLVVGPAGEVVTGGPPTSNVTITGADVTVTVHFEKGRTYALAFARTGLPRGQAWCVNVSGWSTCTAKPTDRYADLTPATYQYSILRPLAGQQITVKLRSAVMGRSGTVNVSANTKLTVEFAYDYNLTFVTTGGFAINWSVTVGHETLWNSSGDQVVFHVANGSYGYKVEAPPGYRAIVSHRKAVIDGSGVQIDVTIRQVYGAPRTGSQG